MTTVSVIIPDYNQAQYLKTAIQSVLNQRYQAHEIIVVDDGSNDNSREIVAQFGNRVKYIHQENRGLAGARNTGIQISTGELIGLLDADDEWESGYLEEMIALANTNPNALGYYCMARCIDVDGNDLPQFVGGPPVEPHLLREKLLRLNFIIPSTVLLKRQPVVLAGMFDSSMRSCEDWDLWLRLLPQGRLIGSSRSLVRYRVHGSSLSTKVEGMHNAVRQLLEKHFGSEDGDLSNWTLDKRRAYGGLYRYQTITFIQRQNNWEAATCSFHNALKVDPSLALDVDLFYELALGSQPVGYRGVSEVRTIETTANRLEAMFEEVLRSPGMSLLRSEVFATAYFSLALVCYASENRSSSRRYFLQAMKHKPGLILDKRMAGMFTRSLLSKEGLNRLKKLGSFVS